MVCLKVDYIARIYAVDNIEQVFVGCINQLIVPNEVEPEVYSRENCVQVVDFLTRIV